jgi:hypothetical protein
MTLPDAVSCRGVPRTTIRSVSRGGGCREGRRDRLAPRALFVALDAKRRAGVERAAKRIGEILRSDAVLEIGTVKTRPHL